ncbi:MAG: hypothetical protein QOK15_2493, partial [Nocardioidaceae bacterium]|nr:hypothetical protein [Nocardioidaceae bacterium]
MSRPAVRASLMTAAVVLVQLAWILTLPPFRGVDEFDHAYRAAAVAHGQWLPRSSAHVRGHGEYVEVPPSLVRAARPVCETYSYTGPDNCRGADRVGGYVEVASGAARYNPVYYWLVGTPASLFSGTANVYALRVVASLICAVFVWGAGYALAVGFRTAWPLLGAAAALTPVFVYSTSIGAPNGVEMTSGLALWSALLALRSRRLPPGVERRLLAVASVSACVLVTTRLLGPLWLLLILMVALPAVGRERGRELVRGHRRATTIGGTAVLLATGAALAWTRIAAPNAISREENLHFHHPLLSSLSDLPLWLLQSLAAFPARNEPAPTLVYGTAAAALLVVLGLAAAGLTRRHWAVLGLVLLVWLGVQLAITVRTYAQLGSVWQGRYALPFVVGVPVLVTAWADQRRQRGPRAVLVAVVAILAVTAHAVSVVHVLRGELRSSPLAGSPEWLT